MAFRDFFHIYDSLVCQVCVYSGRFLKNEVTVKENNKFFFQNRETQNLNLQHAELSSSASSSVTTALDSLYLGLKELLSIRAFTGGWKACHGVTFLGRKAHFLPRQELSPQTL